MKKLLALLMAAGMMLSVAGCGSDAASSAASAAKSEAPAETAAVEETTAAPAENNDASATETATGEGRTFTVGFDAEYPPYGYKDESGEYTGFDLELAQEVCDRNGWTLVKQPIDWDSKDMELNTGAIDCIWNGFTMTGREDDYTFSVPYVDNSIVFVVMNDSDIKSKEDLAGKVVVTQADSSALTALTSEEDNDENLALAASFADLQQVADYNTAFMNLESGAVDAIAVDIGVAQYQLASRGDTFRKLDEPLSTEQYGIGFKKGNEELKDQVQDTLFEMYKDGTFDEIAAKYTDYNLPDMICLGDYVK
ncbi:MAG: amino acid ABC transporter substrate-binding protein [Oscillospiraceae bacterium]|nr:amino acid ABC transporter substrate-binding protein [Oscillospiraceae bacterium]